MDKKSIKKNMVKYDNFARALPIKEKQLIMDEQRKENRLYYLKIVVVVISGILLSFFAAKAIKKEAVKTTLLYQGV